MKLAIAALILVLTGFVVHAQSPKPLVFVNGNPYHWETVQGMKKSARMMSCKDVTDMILDSAEELTEKESKEIAHSSFEKLCVW